MSDIVISGSAPNKALDMLKGTDLEGIVKSRGKDESGNAIGKFGNALEAQIDKVNDTMQAADVQAESYLKGEDTSIHEVMIAMSKADVSFKLMTQIGQRVLSAYQEIQRMQV